MTGFTSAAARRNLVMLAALLALNLVDALLTSAALARGIAIEGNPVVDALGLPGKIALVSFSAILLWRLRPRALVIPVVAYALVVTYSLVGIGLSA